MTVEFEKVPNNKMILDSHNFSLLRIHQSTQFRQTRGSVQLLYQYQVALRAYMLSWVEKTRDR
jgi:hypothetical protein